MPQRLLIIGGTGFIGQHLALSAKNQNLHVTSLSRSNKTFKNSNNLDSFVNIDLKDIETLTDFFNKNSFEYVVNLSGYIDHRGFSDGGIEVIKDHFISSLYIVNLLNRNHLKRYVAVGSSDEYGLLPSPQNETYRESPISPYSFAKTANCHFLEMLYRSENFPVTILRPFLVYGPGQSLDRLVPHSIINCIKNEEFSLTSGKQIRDFCFVEDIVEAILLAIESESALGETINLGSGRPLGVRNLVMMIKELCGGGAPVFGSKKSLKYENPSLYPELSKAKNLLGWEPKYSIEEGLLKTIAFYSETVFLKNE